FAKGPPQEAWYVAGTRRMLILEIDTRSAWRCAVTELAPIATNNPWLHPLAPTQPPSLSERLIRALEAHASAEAHDLATCEALAERSTNPVLRMLIGLVAEDEQRHHSLLQSMVRRLQEEVECVASSSVRPVPQGDSA